MKKPNWKLWLKDKNECKQWLDTYIRKNILKKTKNESEIYARQASHNINFANWVSEHHDEIPTTYEKERYDDWIITVCYYAIYHSALALLSKEGYASKNHAATLCFLIYHHFHSQKALDEEDVQLVAASLDKEDIKTMGETKELRERASYNAGEFFGENLRENIRAQAEKFRDKINELLTL